VRLDNGILDHGFKFPDLAEFPDYENEDRFDEDVDLSPLYKHFVEANGKAFLKELSKYTNVNEPWINKLMSYFYIYSGYDRHSSIIDGDCFYNLYNKGIHITSLPFGDLDVSKTVDKLLNDPDWKPEPGTYDRGVYLDAKNIAFVNDKFKKAGILKAVSAYSGGLKEVKNVFLHVSTPTDYHYKQFMSDATTTPKWTNLHIDPKEDAMKAIVYLEDNVGEENGAFGYVPKSNRFLYKDLDSVFARAISTGNYCRTPEMRKSVFSLPKRFRISNNFGRCILDGSEMSKYFDERFLRVTSNMGNVSIFDAGAGMHMGGKCKTGRRIALQVLMK